MNNLIQIGHMYVNIRGIDAKKVLGFYKNLDRYIRCYLTGQVVDIEKFIYIIEFISWNGSTKKFDINYQNIDYFKSEMKKIISYYTYLHPYVNSEMLRLLKDNLDTYIRDAEIHSIIV